MSFKAQVKKLIPDILLARLSDCRNKIIATKHQQMAEKEMKQWVSNQYFEILGLPLDFDNPQRYTEKIQWCKFNAMDAKKSRLADKYAVRKWVSDKVGEDYLIPLLGVWDDPNDIDFSALPNSFVLKTNNASGTNIIVSDKARLNEARVKSQLKRWLDVEFGWLTFEPQYFAIPPKVIAEKYICNEDGSEASDYKFHCFDGKARFIRVDLARHADHRRATFDLEWNVQGWREGEFAIPDVLPEKPDCFGELVFVAEKLADGFPHARVDLYVVSGRPLFGEITFTSGSGFEPISPIEWDYKLGSMWNLEDEPRVAFHGLGVAK